MVAEGDAKVGPACICVVCVPFFLRSQQQQDPAECDRKLYDLWREWENAFLGMKFNKFRGLFCMCCNFSHTYHMTCRVSEESNGVCNAVLTDTMQMLGFVPRTTGRINTSNART